MEFVHRIAFILFVVVVAQGIFLILRKKGRVKHQTPASLGLLMIAYAILKSFAYIVQGRFTHAILLIHILIFIAGTVVFTIWGIKRKPLDVGTN